MPKRVAGLTARRVQTVTEAGLYADGGGLYLQVGDAGANPPPRCDPVCDCELRFQSAGTTSRANRERLESAL